MQFRHVVNPFDGCQTICSQKNVGPLAAQLPINDRRVVTFVIKICHISQKWSYKGSCFTYYVSFGANMLYTLNAEVLALVQSK